VTAAGGGQCAHLPQHKGLVRGYVCVKPAPADAVRSRQGGIRSTRISYTTFDRLATIHTVGAFVTTRIDRPSVHIGVVGSERQHSWEVCV
jgi:hypothetical protein